MFLKIWLKLVPYRASANLFLESSPRNSYLAAMINVVLLAAVIFCMLSLCRKQGRPSSRLMPLLLFLTCLMAQNGIRHALDLNLAKLNKIVGTGGTTLLAAGGVVTVAFLTLLLIRRNAALTKVCTIAPLLFAPFILVTFGQAIAAIASQEPSGHFQPHAITSLARLRNPLPMSVVWIIFDETDYRLCFEKRPANVALPEFDAFKKTAIWATRAYSPNDATKASLPSLITGIPVRESLPVSACRLDLVRADSGERVDFASQDTIFSQIKSRNGSTALFGWYLPYCRVMRNVDIGHDYPYYEFYVSDHLTDVLRNQWHALVDTGFFFPFGTPLAVSNHISILGRMQADALGALRNNAISFTFLHYPVPHAPNIYDRTTGTFGRNRSREGYFDNAALADRCLGEVRRVMQKAGTWDSAMVIVSSDHHWRSNTYDGQLDKRHVPFMVKFPHQHAGREYNGRFTTVVTRELILDTVDGKIRTPEEAMAWLGRHGAAAR